MHRSRSLAAVILTTLATLLALVALPAPALADCGADATSCKSCHEGQQKLPVNQSGLWHTQHSFGDFCANCHAGDTTAAEAPAAHAGMRPVLSDPNAACASCHAGTYETLAVTYTKTKSSSPPPKAAAKLPDTGSRNTLFVIINIAVLAALAGLVWAFERGPLGRFTVQTPSITPVRRSWNPLSIKRWSPYAAGAGLGVVAVAALWLSQQPLGSSGAYITMAGAGLKAAGAALSESTYFKFVSPPSLTWQLLLVAGVPLGALVSALWGRNFRVETAPDLWIRFFGEQRWKRWLAMFLGGIILEYGASIAGGCTSGLAIAGSLQLSGAGFLFIAGLFTTGLITAKVLYRGNW